MKHDLSRRLGSDGNLSPDSQAGNVLLTINLPGTKQFQKDHP